VHEAASGVRHFSIGNLSLSLCIVDRIEIARILHAARDIEKLFDV
jgi:plasmid stabilization system protein ParE